MAANANAQDIDHEHPANDPVPKTPVRRQGLSIVPTRVSKEPRASTRPDELERVKQQGHYGAADPPLGENPEIVLPRRVVW